MGLYLYYFLNKETERIFITHSYMQKDYSCNLSEHYIFNFLFFLTDTLVKGQILSKVLTLELVQLVFFFCAPLFHGLATVIRSF